MQMILQFPSRKQGFNGGNNPSPYKTNRERAIQALISPSHHIDPLLTTASQPRLQMPLLSALHVKISLNPYNSLVARDTLQYYVGVRGVILTRQFQAIQSMQPARTLSARDANFASNQLSVGSCSCNVT